MAGLHFRTNDPQSLLDKLQKDFSSAPAMDAESKKQMDLLSTLVQKNLAALDDPDERSRQQSLLRQLTGGVPTETGRAVIVLRPGFVSLYKRDHIRMDNLDRQTMEYSSRFGLPVLGAALQGSENFALYAAHKGEMTGGYYWFEEDDCQPADACELCQLLEQPQWADGLEAALDLDTCCELVEQYQAVTGLPLFLDEESCAALALSPVCCWPGASVWKV